MRRRCCRRRCRVGRVSVDVVGGGAEAKRRLSAVHARVVEVVRVPSAQQGGRIVREGRGVVVRGREPPVGAAVSPGVGKRCAPVHGRECGRTASLERLVPVARERVRVVVQGRGVHAVHSLLHGGHSPTIAASSNRKERETVLLNS